MARAEHKGPNNLMLRELGWVDVTGKRDRPRNTDLKLKPPNELLTLRKELMSNIKHPEAFISRVFGSRDVAWVERCAQIIRDFE